MSVSNKKIADCFRVARKLVADHDYKYICNALYRVNYDCDINQATNECIRIVRSGLVSRVTGRRTRTLECWMEAEAEMILGDDDGRFARLAWLDKLIEDYSGEYDGC